MQNLCCCFKGILSISSNNQSANVCTSVLGTSRQARALRDKEATVRPAVVNWRGDLRDHAARQIGIEFRRQGCRNNRTRENFIR